MEQVQEILREYQSQLPLTIRQIFYRLVARHGFEKTEKGYDRLIEMLGRARREPREDKPWKIPFSSIRDDGVTSDKYYGYKDERGFWSDLQWQVDTFTLDLQQFQPCHIEIFCEASGMVPQLAAVAHRYGISVSSSSGFDSVTRKHDFAGYLSGIGKPVILLHIGDLDPSGEHIASSLDEDLSAFLEHYGGDCSLIRLAVTAEQKDRYDLPTAPPKATDKRSFEHAFTVQAEALDPATLAEILEDAILEHTDQDVLAFAKREQKAIRANIRQKFATWTTCHE